MSLSDRLVRLRDFFDRAAPGWAARPFDASLARRLVASIGLRSGARVLDLGSGSGALLPLLRRAAGRTGVLCALDLSPEMLRRTVPGSGAFRVCAAAEALPLRTGGWDAAVCMGVFPHFADRSEALGEIYRVLKPGGRVAIFHTIGREALNALHRQIGGAIAEDQLPGPEDLAHCLETAGFRAVEIADRADFFRALAVRA